MIDLNAFADTVLTFLRGYRIPDLITTLAACALLFVSFDYYQQHKAFPQRKYVSLLALFFLFDGMDYTSFVLQANGSFFELLGTTCDAGVAVTAIIAMFGLKDYISNRRNKSE